MYEFMPNLSEMQIFDKVTVPNLPYIIADRKVSGMEFWPKMGAATAIKNTKSKPFLVSICL